MVITTLQNRDNLGTFILRSDDNSILCEILDNSYTLYMGLFLKAMLKHSNVFQEVLCDSEKWCSCIKTCKRATFVPSVLQSTIWGAWIQSTLEIPLIVFIYILSFSIRTQYYPKEAFPSFYLRCFNPKKCFDLLETDCSFIFEFKKWTHLWEGI